MGFNSAFKGLINVLYVNKQEFNASSWRSNQGYTKMHSQPTLKKTYYCCKFRNQVNIILYASLVCLGLVAKLRQANISLMSVHLSVFTHITIWLPMDGF
jgi:hypothetical protein